MKNRDKEVKMNYSLSARYDLNPTNFSPWIEFDVSFSNSEYNLGPKSFIKINLEALQDITSLTGANPLKEEKWIEFGKKLFEAMNDWKKKNENNN